MRRLKVNIEDIHIKGSLFQLSDVITSIDKVMQKISQETEMVTSLVVKYSSSNSGQQYSRMASTLLELRDYLYEASVEMNEMQNEIVEYQNKVMRYEEVTGSVVLPQKHIVHRTRIEFQTHDMQFRVNDMMQLSSALQKYSASIYFQTQDMVKIKNDAGRFWMDSQYRDFSRFVDENSLYTMNSLKAFGEYVDFLNQRIKELS